MNLGLSTKILLMFGLLALLSAANFVVLLQADQTAEEHHYDVTNAYQVLNAEEILLAHLIDAETGQRGFLLTRQERYLEPYNTSAEQARFTLEELTRLTGDNPAQQERLETIENLMSKRFAELAQTIQLSQDGKHDEAMALVLSDAGQNTMDTLRTQLDEFVAEENRLLDERRQIYAGDNTTRQWIIAGEAILLLGLIAFIGIYIRRKVVNPVIKLTNATRNLIGGNASMDTLEIKGNDEISQLTQAFNNLVMDLQLQISEREQTERLALRLGNFVEESLTEVMIFNALTLRFVMANQGARANLGYSSDELKRMTPTDVFTRMTKERFEQLVAPLRNRQQDVVMHSTGYRRKNDTFYQVDIELRLMHEERPPIFVATANKAETPALETVPDFPIAAQTT